MHYCKHYSFAKVWLTVPQTLKTVSPLPVLYLCAAGILHPLHHCYHSLDIHYVGQSQGSHHYPQCHYPHHCPLQSQLHAAEGQGSDQQLI